VQSLTLGGSFHFLRGGEGLGDFEKNICKYILLTKREGRTKEYRSKVLTVRTERSAVRTKKTEGRYSPSAVRTSLVNKRFITRLKKAKTAKTQVRDHSGQCPVRYLENIGPAIEHFD